MSNVERDSRVRNSVSLRISAAALDTGSFMGLDIENFSGEKKGPAVSSALIASLLFGYVAEYSDRSNLGIALIAAYWVCDGPHAPRPRCENRCVNA